LVYLVGVKPRIN